MPERNLGERRNRVDLERRADAQHQVGVRRERLRLGRPRPPAGAPRRAPRPASAAARSDRSSASPDPLPTARALRSRPTSTPQSRQTLRSIDPWTSTTRREPAEPMEPVDVLGDHAAEEAPALELRECLVRRVRTSVVEAREPFAVEPPEAVRVAVERVDVGDLHRVHVAPQAGPRGAEVRDARGHGDTRPGQRHSPLRPARSGRRAWRRPSLALELGLALAQESRDALLGVLRRERLREPLPFLPQPLVEVGRMRDALDLLDRDRRLSGELPGP